MQVGDPEAVATMQSFRVEDAGQRNMYSFSEALSRNFVACWLLRCRCCTARPMRW
jgi:hypothetical protein